MTKRKKSQGTVKTSALFTAFRENETILRRFLRRFTSNAHDIEDICQETILRALEAEKARIIETPRAFLFGITKNIIRKKLDKESRGIIDFIEDFTPEEYLCNEPCLEEQIESQERMVKFMEAVTTLPAQCQRVFVLKKVYGYSHKEIAKAMGLSISTVEKHVASGLIRSSEYMLKDAKPGAGNNVVDTKRHTKRWADKDSPG